MRRIILAALVLFGLLAPVAAISQTTSYVPDRRLVFTPDVDFYGADLLSLFDTTKTACETACLSDNQCRAFTFNGRSNSCFTKSEITDRQPYDGATSAEVFRTDPRVMAKTIARATDLAYLGTQTLSRARAQAKGIGAMHPSGQWSVETMLDAARDRRAKGDTINAMRWTGGAVSQSDAADQWVEYARLSLDIKSEGSSQRNKYRARALNAAINGYLRALNDGTRVNALAVLAEALEKSGRGRDMVPTLRLAELIQPRRDIVAALDKAVGKYGFRITEHRVDNNSANPRICAEFSEPLVKTGVDYTPYLRLPDQTMAVTAEGNQICVDGAEHGLRYTVVFRKGLPAASGESLIKDVELTLYVRDRDPSVSFPSRAYVLPKTADAGLPIETVNVDKVDLKLRRVSDRNLLRSIQDNYFARPLSYYQDQLFAGEIAEEIWTGTGEVGNTINRDMTTRLPMGDVLNGLEAGIYALTARIPGADVYDDAGATQWFILSDLGISTLSGNDGLHVFVRALSDAQARAGIKVTLLSRANRVLGTTTTDAQGYARFDAGLARGTGGASAALVMVQDGERDLAFLSLTDPAFDLSDRGVEGREPSPPIDVFLATDRGAYRAGEVIHATALARDEVAKSINGLPVTAILIRPDGVEYSRHTSTSDNAGGHVFDLPLGLSVPRGAWRLEIKADVDAPALASAALLVEDFLPERIDFELSLADGPIRAIDTPRLTVDAEYLFGAPGANLAIEGEVTLRLAANLEGFEGYVFGRYDTLFGRQTSYIESDNTDESGRAIIPLVMPEFNDPGRPLTATINLRVKEGSGRPVERRITRAVAPAAPMIGIKRGFDDVVPEGSDAAFQIIAVGEDMTAMDMRVSWTLNRIQRRYQWYQQYGNWNWEATTTRTRVAKGETTLGNVATQVSAPVDWGQYELVVERLDGDYVAAATRFYAGWYAPADTSSTPDTLELSLDQPRYKSGDTATLRVVPRYAGTALISVMSNRLIAMKTVDLVEGENLVPLDVTDEWGAGAYVTATILRPMNVAAGQNPARALGLSYASIEPGAKQLSVTIDTAAESAPRGELTAGIHIEGITEGETAYVTLAAVDLGILNLTGFQSPDPSTHYFGQRRLGVDIRDVYGRLIDGMNGAMGIVRSGGDAGNEISTQSPPPTEDLVAFFSGPVTVDAFGNASISFDIPEFNGTVRLMAVAWSNGAVGQSEKDVLVRDPVVVTASLPRFLAPGDSSRMLVEIVHATGPSGRMGLDITAQGITLANARIPSGINLGDNASTSFSVPITAREIGDHSITIALTTPDGRQLSKTLTIPVRSNDPEVATTRRFTLGAGKVFTFDENVFAGLRAGTGNATLTAGPLARLDAPGLLSALDRYPYGCTEQVTSKAMPLLYFDKVAEAMGLASRAQVQKRVDQAIEKILTRQSSNGAFGLWYPDSGDFWLDAYVSDFLSRARAEGYKVPDLAFRLAMDNLRNRVNYAPDFDSTVNDGGADIAYALMVLAREGAAAMGDLRYYADVKAKDFGTPLAAAQLGAALASYGDQTRADAMFGHAARLMSSRLGEERAVWRADYGTNLRDAAGLLSLAVEAGTNVVDRATLANRIARAGRGLSTQESVWSLLAARALIDDPAITNLTINGTPVNGPLIKVLQDQTQGETLAIRNGGKIETDITLTTFGVPTVAPDAGGYGFRIDRLYYTMDGQQIGGPVQVGDRIVTVLRVTPFGKGEARLMINDPLPAGYEIDNPNLLRAGDISALDWLKPSASQYSEFRSDRFLAAVDWYSDKPFQLAYIVRAISAGDYHHPAATVEDMYRPKYRARTATTRLIITE
ncbi:MAG: alpha-2-macroglobulin family protein [Rhodobacterales bacterium]|nr:alpha-2-macroglobulin family protein [Rhodobacterales bacterium]